MLDVVNVVTCKEWKPYPTWSLFLSASLSKLLTPVYSCMMLLVDSRIAGK